MHRDIYKVIGIILVILGIVSLILGGSEIFHFITGGLEDPAEDSIETVELGDDKKTIYLPEGEYEVWVEGEEVIDLTVEDKENNSVFQEDSTESITINEKSYQKIGDLQIAENGSYTFESDQEATIHITEPISVVTDIFKTCGLIAFGVIGLVVGGLIFVLNLGKDDDQQRPKRY